MVSAKSSDSNMQVRKAAELMGSTPGALHLRTLSTLNDLSSDQSNTIIFAVPIEVLRAFEGGNSVNVAKNIVEKIQSKNDAK